MRELLKLARETLEAYFKGKQPEISKDFQKKYSEKKACFVTISLDGELRGCVGSLYPRQELWKDVVENSINAAVNDSRFPELTLKELNKIKIEISVLSIPKKASFVNSLELKKKINGKGVILKKGFASATYLPQVWEEILDEEEFLRSLCQKAGLSMNSWKEKGIEVWIYDTEKLSE
jgi:AmmeMemoRadiSam system protein A